MTNYQHFHTKYANIYYIISRKSSEKIYYIKYKRSNKIVEEKAGTSASGMTAAKANAILVEKQKQYNGVYATTGGDIWTGKIWGCRWE